MMNYEPAFLTKAGGFIIQGYFCNMTTNLQRLMQLADDVFAVKSDPHQLQVNAQVIHRLKLIHPSTLMEYADRNGPVAWVLLIPTTEMLMQQFLNKSIDENELFEQTPVNKPYDAIYLCSALVLEEYRRKGITTNLVVEAILDIKKTHPIKSLFVWPFTNEGSAVANHISELTNLPLYSR
jgi:hypothetical protein